MPIRIRAEAPGDHAGVRAVHEAAFETAAEASLVEALRRQARPLVSMVAEQGGGVVGHILFTPMTLPGHAAVHMMGLAPMAVLPAYQRQGIGTALVQAGLAACHALGAGAVLVLGHPDYYPRFGFRPASTFGLACPYAVPDEVFLATELVPGILADADGTPQYHPAFDSL